MRIEEGLEALQRADLIPDDLYTVKIISVKDVVMKKLNNKPGCVAKLEIVEAQDPSNNVPEILGRVLDYWLVGKTRAGLRRLLEHLKQTNEGFDGNVPGGDTANLVELTFKARITSSENPNTNEWENRAIPL